VSDIFGALSEESRARLRRRRRPKRTGAMLATLAHEAFSDPGWIYERKLDGVRCLVFREEAGVRLVSRSGKGMNASWPELVEDLEKEPCDDFVADGEIVAFEGRRTSFERLQGRMQIQDPREARATGIAVYLYLFDLLYARGHDTTRVSQRHRKALLKRALSSEGHVRYTRHRNREGERYLKEACGKGWEGLIAKDAAAPYSHRRSRRWLKLKCVSRQELVIGGYTDPEGSRQGFGALMVGYFENGDLRYAGKVGTGYDEETLQSLAKRLRRLERRTSPFAGNARESGAHFVQPRLVGEFGFTEWTGDGKLRHPRFLGLRHDKEADQVRRERARA
jgi:bifunctional non-homologous end joining protein LigD